MAIGGRRMPYVRIAGDIVSDIILKNTITNIISNHMLYTELKEQNITFERYFPKAGDMCYIKRVNYYQLVRVDSTPLITPEYSDHTYSWREYNSNHILIHKKYFGEDTEFYALRRDTSNALFTL